MTSYAIISYVERLLLAVICRTEDDDDLLISNDWYIYELILWRRDDVGFTSEFMSFAAMNYCELRCEAIASQIIKTSDLT